MARILIADDEKDIRNTLSEFVKEGGHEVLMAENAGECLRLFREGRFAFDLTPFRLPSQIPSMTQAATVSLSSANENSARILFPESTSGSQ